MKPLASPADQKKAVVLVIGVVLVFGFVIKNTMSAVAGGSPPPADGVVTISGTGAPTSGGNTVVIAAPPTGVAVVKDVDDPIDAPVFTAIETPNPFHKDTESYSGAEDYHPEVQAVPPVIVDSVRRGKKGRKYASAEPYKPITGDILPDAPGGSVPDIKPEADTLQIMGVITGVKPVAVIRVGSQQYVVDRGSKFGRDFRLKDVSDTQVVIEQGSALRILRVGARPPSTPSSPPPDPTPAAPATAAANKAIGAP